MPKKRGAYLHSLLDWTSFSQGELSTEGGVFPNSYFIFRDVGKSDVSSKKLEQIKQKEEKLYEWLGNIVIFDI